MLSQTAYAHIVIDDEGVPYLAGTETKVIELVLDRLAYVDHVRNTSVPSLLVMKLKAQGLLP